jgi:hypothetical protein
MGFAHEICVVCKPHADYARGGFGDTGVTGDTRHASPARTTPTLPCSRPAPTCYLLRCMGTNTNFLRVFCRELLMVQVPVWQSGERLYPLLCYIALTIGC